MPQKKINSQRREVPLFWLLDFPLRVNNKYLYRGDNRLRHGWNVWTSLHTAPPGGVFRCCSTRWCCSWCILSDYWLRTYSKISWECGMALEYDVTLIWSLMMTSHGEAFWCRLLLKLLQKVSTWLQYAIATVF